MAVFWVAEWSLFAIVLRIRVIGTLSSIRLLLGWEGCETGAAAGSSLGISGAATGSFLASSFGASSGLTWVAFTGSSWATCSSWGVSSFEASAESSKRPRTCCSLTVSPSSARISVRMPDSSAGTSRTTLSVSISTITSSTSTESPGFLCHAATVASLIDSGKTGTFTSFIS